MLTSLYLHPPTPLPGSHFATWPGARPLGCSSGLYPSTSARVGLRTPRISPLNHTLHPTHASLHMSHVHNAFHLHVGICDYLIVDNGYGVG